MKISILIPTKNRLPILRETLHNIYYVNTLPKEDFEVIVSNDGDDDLSVLYEEFPFDNLKIVQNTHKPGAAGNRNNAADYAQYDLLQFLDDDILITENFLEKAIYWHELIEGKIIFSGYITYSEALKKTVLKNSFAKYRLVYIYDDWQNKRYNRLLNNDSLYETSMVVMATLSISKKLFYTFNGFNEDYIFGLEDWDFFERLKKENIRFLIDTKCICYHNELDYFILDNWINREKRGMYDVVIYCNNNKIAQNHPTWYTNTPLKKSDPKDVKLLKLKKIFCSFPTVYKFLHFLAIYGEKIKLPDSFLFRLYNALWLGATYRSFREAYKEIFNNKLV